MTTYPTDFEADRAICALHNERGCSSCNKVEGECAFGDCQSTAATAVHYLDPRERVVEVRAVCLVHAAAHYHALPPRYCARVTP